LQESYIIRAHLENLFVHDGQGRIMRTNKRAPSPAPRFFLSMGTAGKEWRVREDLAPGLASRLSQLASKLVPAHQLVEHSPKGLAGIRRELAKSSGVAPTESGPAYYFLERLSATDTVELTRRNLSLTERTFPWLTTEIDSSAPVFAVVRDGAAVAICFCARLPTAVVEAGVNTLEGYRGLGYATQAATAWATAVRRAGRIPLYSTSWRNLASRGVARRLGLIQYAIDFSLR
jgi:GNAT acetyltransferase